VEVIDSWKALNHKVRYLREARAEPWTRALLTRRIGDRFIVALFPDWRVGTPFGAFAGENGGPRIAELSTGAFHSRANARYGTRGNAQDVTSELIRLPSITSTT
jgi:hypothetical protein